MVFLMDFENVSNSGFDGLEGLEKTDSILIFYSEKSSSLSIPTHRKLEASPVKKEYYPVKIGGKNALDFQLSTYLGYCIASDKILEYCIVSNDTGFDFVIDFWKKQKIKVIRCSNLFKQPKESIETGVKKALPQYATDTSAIVSIIEKYKTKQGINNALVKKFGSEKTGIIYKAIKPLISNKKEK